MPELTRRRSIDAREECWHVYYGDVLAGTIPIGSGNPHDKDPWEWHCGFYVRPTIDSHRIEDTIIHVPHTTARGGCEIRH